MNDGQTAHLRTPSLCSWQGSTSQKCFSIWWQNTDAVSSKGSAPLHCWLWLQNSRKAPTKRSGSVLATSIHTHPFSFLHEPSHHVAFLGFSPSHCAFTFCFAFFLQFLHVYSSLGIWFSIWSSLMWNYLGFLPLDQILLTSWGTSVQHRILINSFPTQKSMEPGMIPGIMIRCSYCVAMNWWFKQTQLPE